MQQEFHGRTLSSGTRQTTARTRWGDRAPSRIPSETSSARSMVPPYTLDLSRLPQEVPVSAGARPPHATRKRRTLQAYVCTNRLASTTQSIWRRQTTIYGVWPCLGHCMLFIVAHQTKECNSHYRARLCESHKVSRALNSWGGVDIAPAQDLASARTTSPNTCYNVIRGCVSWARGAIKPWAACTNASRLRQRAGQT